METGILFGVVTVSALIISAWAHFAGRNRGLAVAITVAIALLGGLLVLTGAILVIADLSSTSLNEREAGIVSLAMGTAILLPLIGPLRRVAARVLPFDPYSVPDKVGLTVLLGSATFFAVTSLFAQDELEVSSIGAYELVAQALMFVLIAYFGVGLFFTRDFRSANRRLGLGWLTGRQLAVALGLVLLAFMITGTAGALTQIFQPDLSQEIEERTGTLTENVSSLSGALTLGLSAGIGEEMLFRGAVQPRFGIVFTALVFALIHIQYGFSFIVVGVFFVSILFGIERQRINTTAAIVTHVVYDVIAVLLSSLAPS